MDRKISFVRIFLISFLFATSWSCTSIEKQLSEEEVRVFLQSFFDAQTEGNVEAYNNTMSDSLLAWSNAVWPGGPSIVKKENTKAEWFYEDSIQHTIHDISYVGKDAHIMGSARWFSAGVKTFGMNFSGIVGEENGRMVWKRFTGVWNHALARNFLWPSTELKGGLSAYNEMRKHMSELSNEQALAISDTLVDADPNWATAHLGQLHYYWFNQDKQNLQTTFDAAMSKLQGASLAEQYFIKSYDPAEGADARGNLRMALLHAPDDPMIRTWYAWGEKDYEVAVDILSTGLARNPDNTALNNMIAYKYMNEGEMELAEKHFLLNMNSNPDVANVHDSYGYFLLRQGDSSAAKTQYLKAFELDPSFTVSKGKADAL